MIERRKSRFIPFKTGDKVWLDMRNLKMSHHKKIRPRREGPFKIMKVIRPVTYQLQLPKTWKIHNMFHATQLQQYKETEVYGVNFPKPPPELIKGEECMKLKISEIFSCLVNIAMNISISSQQGLLKKYYLF